MIIEDIANKQLNINQEISNNNINNSNMNTSRYKNSSKSGYSVYSEAYDDSKQIQNAYNNKRNSIKSIIYSVKSSFSDSINEKDENNNEKSEIYESCIQSDDEKTENYKEFTKKNFKKEEKIEIINTDININNDKGNNKLTNIYDNHLNANFDDNKTYPLNKKNNQKLKSPGINLSNINIIINNLEPRIINKQRNNKNSNFSGQLTPILENYKGFNYSNISNSNCDGNNQLSSDISKKPTEKMKKIESENESEDKKESNNDDNNNEDNDNNNINTYSNRNSSSITNKELNDVSKNIDDDNVSLNFSEETYNNNINYLNEVKFENIDENEINLEFLIKSNIRKIPIKYRKNIKESEKYFKTVLELQNFYLKGRKCDINIAKLSENCKYFSIGCEDGRIILYKVMGHNYENYKKSYDKNEIISFLSFIEEEPYKELIGHEKDISDLSWSPFIDHYLLSASLDHSVILWNINNENMLIKKFDHDDVVTCVCFSPIDKNIFVSGCMSGLIVIWNIHEYKKEKNIDKIKNIDNSENYKINSNSINNSEEETSRKNINFKNLHRYINGTITAIKFFPTGDKIAVGTLNGKIEIYKYKKSERELKLFTTFNCKSKFLTCSFGKKINGIEFLNKNSALISTCDSNIIFLKINEGKLSFKYKGHEVENAKISCAIDYQNNVIISGSENGFCYIWNIYSNNKNEYDECFQPFPDEIVQCVQVINEKCYCSYVKKFLKLTGNIFIKSIIIITTNNSRIEVLLNIDDSVN